MEKGFIENHFVKFLLVFCITWIILIQFYGTWDGEYTYKDENILFYSLGISTVLYTIYHKTNLHKFSIGTVSDSEKIKSHRGIIILILLILVAAFYWLSLRPTQIKLKCYDLSRNTDLGMLNEKEYKRCLAKFGL